MKRISGFSMIEIIVTLIIISIVTVIAAPNIKNVLMREHLNQSSADLINVLQKAQSRAVLEKKVISVYVGSAPTLTDTDLNWMPSGNATLRGGATRIYISKSGYLQKTATNTAFDGVKNFIVCSQGGTHSRKITFNRIGVVTDSGVRENCSAE